MPTRRPLLASLRSTPLSPGRRRIPATTDLLTPSPPSERDCASHHIASHPGPPGVRPAPLRTTRRHPHSLSREGAGNAGPHVPKRPAKDAGRLRQRDRLTAGACSLNIRPAEHPVPPGALKFAAVEHPEDRAVPDAEDPGSLSGRDPLIVVSAVRRQIIPRSHICQPSTLACRCGRRHGGSGGGERFQQLGAVVLHAVDGRRRRRYLERKHYQAARSSA